MGRRDRYPSGDTGADSDYRFDQIEGNVALGFSSQIRASEYESAYNKAQSLKDAGKSEEEIKKTCRHAPILREHRSEESTHTTDLTKAHNRVERAKQRVVDIAIDDVIAGRPKKIPDFLA